MGLEPKIGVKPPKMDGENHGSNPIKMDDLGGTIICGNTHVILFGNIL